MTTPAILALEDGTVITNNLPWRLSLADLRTRLGFDDVRLVNDFEAVAHAAAQVDASQVLQLTGPAIAPTRGPSRVCTFTQVSRVLAGFPDGLADEGVGAGTASLRGVELARREGWTAPDSGDATPDAAPTNDASTEGTATGEQTSVDTPANEPDERPTSDGKEGQA